MNPDIIAEAGAIFLLRVLGNMITTVRLITLIRGMKIAATVLAVFEALVFALAIGSVVSNLMDVWNMAAYCLGYAVGGYLGMLLEGRIVHHFVSVRIISPQLWHEIANAIRDAGFGATESVGFGGSGEVGWITSVVSGRDVTDVIRIARGVDPSAFVTTDELRGISRGYFRMARPEQH